MMLKKGFRILGIDDGPFTFQARGRLGKVPIVGVVMRGKDYLEGIWVSEITVDGNDATDKIAEMINNSRFKSHIRAVLINGGAVGGFNVIDISSLHKQTGLPVITLTRHKPDFDDIEKALKAHFKDWKKRLAVLRRHRLISIPTGRNPLYAKSTGIKKQDVIEMICASTKRGNMPECLRIAHIVASAIVRGESYGNA